MIQRGLLVFRGARYLWWSAALIVGSIALYATERSPKSGSTWQGYLLGTVGAALIACLALLAVRKRLYASTLGTVQGWTSAHVYLGSALVVVASLHCAFQFGRNVHTLAFVLMCVVIVSGLVGLSSYLSTPSRVADNRAGATRALLFTELFELDKQTRLAARKCSAAVEAASISAVGRTALGGGVLAQLLGRDGSYFVPTDTGKGTPLPNRDQQAVIDLVAARLPRAEKAAEAECLQSLLVLLCRRQVVLRRLRVDIRLAGWLKLWLHVHVPVTCALLVALAAHVASTFVYR